MERLQTHFMIDNHFQHVTSKPLLSRDAELAESTCDLCKSLLYECLTVSSDWWPTWRWCNHSSKELWPMCLCNSQASRKLQEYPTKDNSQGHQFTGQYQKHDGKSCQVAWSRVKECPWALCYDSQSAKHRWVVQLPPYVENISTTIQCTGFAYQWWGLDSSLFLKNCPNAVQLCRGYRESRWCCTSPSSAICSTE